MKLTPIHEYYLMSQRNDTVAIRAQWDTPVSASTVETETEGSHFKACLCSIESRQPR